METTTHSNTRDLSLVILAGFVAVTAMICTTVLAFNGTIESAAAVGVLSGAGGTLAGVAIGRLSGTSSTVEVAPAVPVVAAPATVSDLSDSGIDIEAMIEGL